MGQSFHRVDNLVDAATAIAAHARQRDVFVGVIARQRRRGGRQDVVHDASLVWADCDDPRSVAALRRFEPMPSMVVASGTASNCHAYWFLARPVSIDAVERTNRRLALALDADPRSCDAARILRPGGTNNWKEGPCRSVRLARLDPGARIDLDDIQHGLPQIAAEPRAHHEQARARSPHTDELLQIKPREYVEHLSGRQVGRDRKINCPFHDDTSPSLHVFDEAERGWYCFGCGHGGSIYDFAALLWGRGLRGTDFLRLRQELRETFFGRHERPEPRKPLRAGPPRHAPGVPERSVI
jgi:hypothetical protein